MICMTLYLALCVPASMITEICLHTSTEADSAFGDVCTDLFTERCDGSCCPSVKCYDTFITAVSVYLPRWTVSFQFALLKGLCVSLLWLFTLNFVVHWGKKETFNSYFQTDSLIMFFFFLLYIDSLGVLIRFKFSCVHEKGFSLTAVVSTDWWVGKDWNWSVCWKEVNT